MTHKYENGYISVLLHEMRSNLEHQNRVIASLTFFAFVFFFLSGLAFGTYVVHYYFGWVGAVIFLYPVLYLIVRSILTTVIYYKIRYPRG